MRNRVVNVEEIERVALRDLRHSRRQCERVWRVMEQGICGDFYFVIVNARGIRIEANGIGIANEVHLVTTMGELETQLSRHNAAAAVCGIARDPDPHDSSISGGEKGAAVTLRGRFCRYVRRSPSVDVRVRHQRAGT